MPARALERLVLDACIANLSAWTDSNKSEAAQIEAASQEADGFVERLAGTTIQEQRAALLDLATSVRLLDDEIVVTVKLASDEDHRKFSIAATLVRRGIDLRMVSAPDNGDATQEADPVLARLVAHAFAAQSHLLNDTPCNMVGGYTRRHLNRLAKLSCLAPDIIAAIMAGTQPPQLTGRKLLRVPNLSNDWTEQRRQLGF